MLALMTAHLCWSQKLKTEYKILIYTPSDTCIYISDVSGPITAPCFGSNLSCFYQLHFRQKRYCCALGIPYTGGEILTKIIWQNISFYLGPYALLRNFSKFLTKFKGKLKRFKEINFAIEMMQFKVLVYLTLGSLINSLC